MRADLVQLPRALFRASTIREQEPRLAEQLNIPLYQVMEAAGEAAWQQLLRRWPQCQALVVLCGGGNNAGDGYVLARLAKAQGRQVRLLQAQPERALTGDAARAQQAWLASGGEVLPLQQIPADGSLYVDALVGTGLRGPLRQEMAQWVEQLNRLNAPVLSLDIPSGLNGETGAVTGLAVKATHTITFVGVKPALLTGAAREYVGELSFAPLQLGQALAARPADVLLGSPRQLKDWLPDRSVASHKGQHGRVLLLGGEAGMGGALLLAAGAALRVGTGLVAAMGHQSVVAPMLARHPEVMVEALESEALAQRLAWADAIVLGPGLGQGAVAAQCLPQVLAQSQPVLLDADGLNWLAEHPRHQDNWVLTPHPGEAARLLGCSVAEIEADRFGAARRLQQRYGGVVVLKGPGTLIDGGDGPQLLLPVGNPGLATGGSGDLLSGIIGGLLSQGLAPMSAACAGVLIHGEAADDALGPGPKGMLPSDLLPHIRNRVNQGDV